MKTYTLICYRPNGYDRCGYTSDSEFDITVSTNLQEIIEAWATTDVNNRSIQSHECETETTLLIDGVIRMDSDGISITTYAPDDEELDYEWFSESDAIADMFERRKNEILEAQRLARIEKEKADKEAKEALGLKNREDSERQERETLDRLAAKYGFNLEYPYK